MRRSKRYIMPLLRSTCPFFSIGQQPISVSVTAAISICMKNISQSIRFTRWPGCGFLGGRTVIIRSIDSAIEDFLQVCVSWHKKIGKAG